MSTSKPRIGNQQDSKKGNDTLTLALVSLLLVALLGGMFFYLKSVFGL